MSNKKSPENKAIGIALGLAAAGALAWLLHQIAKKPKGQVIYYRCPACGVLVRPHVSFCQSCGQPLVWEEKGNPDKGRHPEQNSSSFLVIRIMGGGFIFSLVILAVCTFVKVSGMFIWSHLASVLGGYLLGLISTTYHPSA